MILDKKAMQKHTFLLVFFGQNEHLSQLLGNVCRMSTSKSTLKHRTSFLSKTMIQSTTKCSVV